MPKQRNMRHQSYDCHVTLRNFHTHADSAQPRILTLYYTRPSFRAGAREGLGMRLTGIMPFPHQRDS